MALMAGGVINPHAAGESHAAAEELKCVARHKAPPLLGSMLMK